MPGAPGRTARHHGTACPSAAPRTVARMRVVARPAWQEQLMSVCREEGEVYFS